MGAALVASTTGSYTAGTPTVGSLAGMMNAVALDELRDEHLVDLTITTYLGERVLESRVQRHSASTSTCDHPAPQL